MKNGFLRVATVAQQKSMSFQTKGVNNTYKRKVCILQHSILHTVIRIGQRTCTIVNSLIFRSMVLVLCDSWKGFIVFSWGSKVYLNPLCGRSKIFCPYFFFFHFQIFHTILIIFWYLFFVTKNQKNNVENVFLLRSYL